MRMLLSCAIVVGLVLVATAAPQKKGDKGKAAAIDKDLLVGKWQTPAVKAVKGAKPPAREFTKDGKCYLGSPDGKGPRLEGTYELENDNLTIKWAGAPGVPGEVQKYKVTKLTKTELIMAVGKRTETWKRGK
ncbi:MAG TPA: hypothetical protein VH643_39380 [Gemmataceae bacterium]